jgi:hypothetical protein
MQRVNECIAQLREMTSWNSFAASLVAQYDSKGSLSVAQVEAAERMFAKMTANAANKSAAKAVDLSNVHKMFDAALAHGLKRPRFAFGDLRLSLASETSRNAGAVYVKLGGEYAGKVQGGVYHPVGAGSVATAQAIATIAADPLAAAVQHGRDTGQCACCGRTLTDPESVARGIGPICAAHWGIG